MQDDHPAVRGRLLVRQLALPAEPQDAQPWLVFALPAGAIADRRDRRSVMLLANITRATLLAGLLVAVLVEAGSLWVLHAAETSSSCPSAARSRCRPPTGGPCCAPRSPRRVLGTARTIGIAFFMGAASLGVPALTADPVIIGAAFFVGGAGLIVSNVTTVSLRQRITPDRLLGRTNSSHRLVAYGTRPLGALAGGLLAESFGLQPVFAVMSLLAMTTVFGATKVTTTAVAEAERRALHSPA